MKLWTSSEAWVDVSSALSKASNHIEQVVNDNLADRNYGQGVGQWAFIAILLPTILHEQYPERFQYHKSDKSIEFRLRIDLDAFQKADDASRKKLIAEALLRSLDILDQKKKIPEFDHHKLRADFLAIAKEHSWL